MLLSRGIGVVQSTLVAPVAENERACFITLKVALPFDHVHPVAVGDPNHITKPNTAFPLILAPSLI